MAFDASQVTAPIMVNDDVAEELLKSEAGEALMTSLSRDVYRDEMRAFLKGLRERMVTDLKTRLMGKTVIFRDEGRRYEMHPDGGPFDETCLNRGTVVDIRWTFAYDDQLEWRATIEREDGTRTSAYDYELFTQV